MVWGHLIVALLFGCMNGMGFRIFKHGVTEKEQNVGAVVGFVAAIPATYLAYKFGQSGGSDAIRFSPLFLIAAGAGWLIMGRYRSGENAYVMPDQRGDSRQETPNH